MAKPEVAVIDNDKTLMSDKCQCYCHSKVDIEPEPIDRHEESDCPQCKKETKLLDKIFCFMGLHRPGETWGIYRFGSCIHCGLEDMWF